MEASSIGISENRIDGLRFKAAVFTNLTWDHIHFHGSMEEYANTKAQLFRGLSSNSIAVVNRDDPYHQTLIKDTAAYLYFYGKGEKSQFQADDTNVTLFSILSNTIDGVTLNLDGNISTFNLTGEFNAYNLAAAYTFLKASGFNKQESINALERAAAPPGRFQIIHKDAGESYPKKVIVDYAHTPDALEKVLQTVIEIRNPGAKLILVFGCTGERDKKKRPLMGAVAEKYADQIYLTSDDSYSEETSEIIQHITEGMSGSAYIIEENRKRAIERAIFESPEDSVVLIAGKGHEKFQFLQGKKYEHSDIEYSKKIFDNYLH
jgi:UDP-N-acetylmuramoyl-L-alanyl-D-glutamate--2,6-diaminopimelate ligase